LGDRDVGVVRVGQGELPQRFPIRAVEAVSRPDPYEGRLNFLAEGLT
jgi:hypothetical protein